jgi:hypothetical protein
MGGLSYRHLRQLLTVSCCLIACSTRSNAQASRTTTLDFGTGSQFEDYLRVLQVAGLEPLGPWSVRGFSPRTIARFAAADSVGPWAITRHFVDHAIGFSSLGLGLVFNSAYPYGSNDGPVWAGRGLTVVASAGIFGHAGGFSFSIAPKAFSARNNSFELLANGVTGPLAYNNGLYPNAIDLPQRFGNGAYSRIDPDASGIRFDSRYFGAGVSTANEWIGPATEYPFLLGDNAGGFPHLFVTTGDSWNLWVARLHSRVMWGKLNQSDYSPVSGPARYESRGESGTVRLAAAAQLALVPRGIPGLELGFARFIHTPYFEGEPSSSFWRKPFKVFFLKNEFAHGDTVGADNQLASAFFRWVFPHSGFELYGERGHDDQFYDLRDFSQDPDHEREYMLGFQKTFRQTVGSLDVLKFEAVNYQLPTIARLRHEGAIYTHSQLRQGHTNEGQLLGVAAGPGPAAASVIEWIRYSHTGSTSALLRRIVQAHADGTTINDLANAKGSDVVIAGEVERLRFGQHADFSAKVGLMQNYNRNFAKDVPNLNIELTARLHSL